MIDEMYLRKMIGEWADAVAVKNNISFLYWDDLFAKVRDYILQVLAEKDGMTEEKAIDYLNKTGWMHRHDRTMSYDSLTAVVNGLMLDGNKTISVNVYPWREDDDG